MFRRAAAANRSTPPESLDMLAAAPETVMFVAGNPNCPPNTLASTTTSVCSPATPDPDANNVRMETCAQLARNRFNARRRAPNHRGLRSRR